MATCAQHYNLSCGAACLLAAALELGITTLPRIRRLPYSLWHNPPIPLVANDVNCEARIYQVTTQSIVGDLPQNWDISLPSNIVKCTRHLALQALVIAYDTFTVSMLKKRYPNEMPTLRSLNALREESAGHSAFKPNPRQRELKVLIHRALRQSNVSMHYVMVRNNGTVMDPAGGGVEYTSINEYHTAKNHYHHGTGLSVFIQR
jgi:hypothetical protein